MMRAPVSGGIPSPARVVGSALTSVAIVVACLLGLEGLVAPGPWVTSAAVMLAVTTAAIVGARLWLRATLGPDVGTGTSLLPSLVGTLVGAWLLVARFSHSAPRATKGGPFDLALGLDDIRAFGALVRSIEEVAVTAVAPSDPLEAIVAILVTGAFVVLILIDMFVAVRVPALASITVVLIWIPSLMIVGSVPVPIIIAVGLLFLVLLALDNPFAALRRSSAPGATSTSAVRAAAAGIVVVALVATLAPQVSRLPGNGTFSALDLRVGVTSLSETLDLRRSLEQQSDREVLSYTIEQGAVVVGPLRTTTLYDFDGRTWEPTSTRLEPLGAELVPHDSPGDLATEARVRLKIAGLRSKALPVPIEPRSLISGASASYDARRDALELTDPTRSGDDILLGIRARDLEADALRAASPDVGASYDPFEDVVAGRELAKGLPQTSYSQDVAGVAATVTRDARTRYDAAVALQDFFRTDPRFRYSLTVPAQRSDDAVWDFLQDGTGYCVQFATAMTIMARHLGMPARIGIGYLPGEPARDGSYVVRGRDAHAWPEIYFPDMGWVRFEPTPASQSGAAPVYTAPTASPSPTPTPTPTRTSQPTTSAPSSSVAPTAAAQADAQRDAVVPTVAVTLAALLVLAVGVTMLARRRRSEATADLTPELAWRTLLDDAASLGFAVPPSASVRTVADLLWPSGESGAGADGAQGRLDGDGPTPVHVLAALVERSRYAPDRPTEQRARRARRVEPTEVHPDAARLRELVALSRAHLVRRAQPQGEASEASLEPAR